MKLAWPEKVVGFLLACELTVVAWFLLTSRTAGSADQAIALASSLTHILFGALLPLVPLWLLLRMIDWMAAGPARRKEHITARFSP